MNWFYVKNGAQAGPVDKAELDRLVQTGEISRDTLVWQTGMESWQKYALVAGGTPPPPPPPPSTPGNARCMECGQEFPPPELVTLAGRSVCASCKPLAVQKFQEGVAAFGQEANADELWRKVQQRGFDFTISSVLSRVWDVYKGNFWPCVGVILLGYLITTGVGQIPLLNILAVFLVKPQMLAGLQWYLLKQFRRQEATLNDSFAGFQRGYGNQALYMLIVAVLVVVAAIVIAIPVIAIGISLKPKSDTAFAFGAIALIVPLLFVVWYFILRWSFTPLLILDKGLSALDAMKLSWRVSGLRIWKMFGLLLIIALFGLLGLIALLVGVIFVLPLAYGTFARLYEDAFGEEGPVTRA